KKHFAMEVGYGWYFPNRALLDKEEELYGCRGRVGFRYMFKDHSNTLPFLGVEGKYNYIFERVERPYWRHERQYQENLWSKSVYNILGVALKGGVQFHVLKSRRLLLEVCAGLRLKVSM